MPETQAPGTHPSGPASGSSGEPREDILACIVATKRREIEGLRPQRRELRSRAERASPPRDFARALRRGGSVALVAEIKRRSPGAGAILPGLDTAALSREYADSGASAISVLTDREYFGGALEDLERVRNTIAVPVLRKDFVLSEEQVWESRGAGADAILLIVRILDDAEIAALRSLAEELGMAALVEVHDAEELDRGLGAGARVLGINNRDLGTFRTRIEITLDLVSRVPDDLIIVSESGIQSRHDVERLGGAGVDAILVGEALLRAGTPGDKARELSGVPKELRRRSLGQRRRVP
ncbi:MAG: indole-3-glycerol phosphate synthase TrpC [Gemmatimonadetes bacterium]|nr:indole-3-glycerol phosphate synthase TrpC [Gemmatimonadota bacterium]